MPRLSPGNFAPCSGLQKSTKPYARKQSTPCLALVFTSGKNRPCVAWEKGHSEPWTPGSTAPQHKAVQGRQRGRGGAAAWQRKKIPKETPEVNTMVAWTRASPPKPIMSMHRVVFSPLYLFTGQRRTPQPRSVRLCVGERGYPIPGHGVGTTPPGEKCGARKARRFFA